MIRVGIGFDVHPLIRERALILGGVRVPSAFGLLGHSDADVLVHAVTDALLGALALGDIGTHFPDRDPRYAGADSLELMASVKRLLNGKEYQVGNVDAVIIAQKPRLAEYLPEMAANMARVLAVDADRVSVKATTTEQLGFIGRAEGIAAQAVVLLMRTGAP